MKLLALLLFCVPAFANDQAYIYYVCDQPAIIALKIGNAVYTGSYDKFINNEELNEMLITVVIDPESDVQREDVKVVECPLSA